MKPFHERRRHPRVAESLPFQVGTAAHWVATRTINLSCGGALCVLPESVPVLTKLQVSLEVPVAPANGGPSVREVHCEGVVVRQQPSSTPGQASLFETAIFFSDLQPEDRRCLAEFILQRMLSHGA